MFITATVPYLNLFKQQPDWSLVLETIISWSDLGESTLVRSVGHTGVDVNALNCEGLILYD